MKGYGPCLAKSIHSLMILWAHHHSPVNTQEFPKHTRGQSHGSHHWSFHTNAIEPQPFSDIQMPASYLLKGKMHT